MNEFHTQRTLSLTEDEAMGLLDIVLLTPVELSPEQRAATEKLSNFCRELIRASACTRTDSAISNIEVSGSEPKFADRELLPSK